MNTNDIVLTGPPRSGTTVSCELLNLVDDTVALDEPLDSRPWMGKRARTKDAGRVGRLLRRGGAPRPRSPAGPDAFCALVERFFDEARAGLLSGEGAITLHHGGSVLGRKFPDRTGSSGLREFVTERSVMAVEKPLTPDFVLVVKQIAGFTAMLESLSERFRCFAVVRNPLSTLSSWQTVSVPIKEGHVPHGELMDEELRRKLAATPSAINRQFVILHWFYDLLARFLPPSSVIRYEEIVATGGRALSPISPSAAGLDRPLDNRNRAAVYDRASTKALGERLLAEDGKWWLYYTPDSVRELMEGA